MSPAGTILWIFQHEESAELQELVPDDSFDPDAGRGRSRAGNPDSGKVYQRAHVLVKRRGCIRFMCVLVAALSDRIPSARSTSSSPALRKDFVGPKRDFNITFFQADLLALNRLVCPSVQAFVRGPFGSGRAPS